MTTRSLFFVTLFILATLLPRPATAQDASPEAGLGEGIVILPADEVVAGKNVDEWAASWADCP